MANTTYYSQIQPIVEIICVLFMQIASALFSEMMKSAKATRLLPKMFGPFQTLAILYKLQIGLHNDSKDFGLTAMTNFGSYTGGALIIPVLGLKCR